jgi:segregation and condensation protein B
MELISIVEALLFSSNGALSAKAMAEAVRTVAANSDEEEMRELAKVTPAKIEEAIELLIETYRDQKRAFTLTERASGWRICALPEYADWSRALFPVSKPSRLSPPALETLAIIAYRQPVTKASMEAVRGVSVDGVLQTLMDRNLVKISGRSDLPGRPLLYETTDLFLEHFGVRSVEDLPNSAELRQVSLPDHPPSADTEAADTSPSETGETQLNLVAIDDASQTAPRNQAEFLNPPPDQHSEQEAGEHSGEQEATSADTQEQEEVAPPEEAAESNSPH